MQRSNFRTLVEALFEAPPDKPFSGRRNTAACILVVLVITGTGLLFELQGWRTRIPTFDLLPYIDSAHQLITNGRLPDRGTLTSYASYAPPGTAWLMVPGLLLFTDPRLYEYPGSAILYFGTLVGIFLLARAYFGVGCALLAVAIYGLSRVGLFYAASLWPRGHPFFYVWMAYWTTCWVMRRNTTYLAAAIVTWAAGMYVFMEIAPAIFILPAAWLLYRPPLKVGPLLLGTILALAIWYPYLRFEFTRNFVDLRSQVLRHTNMPDNYKESWCDPKLNLVNVDGTHDPSNIDSDQAVKVTDGIWTKALTLVQPLWGRRNVIAAGLFSNFQQNPYIPGTRIALGVLVLISLIVLSVSATSAGAAEIIVRRWRFWLPRFAGGMILFGVLWNEFFIARYLSLRGILEASTILSIRWEQGIAVLIGITLLMLRSRIIVVVDHFVHRVASPAGVGARTTQCADVRLLALSLIIPWLILLLIVEDANRMERLWWLWPLQVIVLAASVTYVLSLLRAPGLFTWIGSLALIVMLLATPSMLSRSEAWLQTGWAGSDSEEIRVVDYVASRLKGQNQTAIGYQIFTWGFNATYNAVDPLYKVGADLDLLFKHRYGVSNTNRCAEGVSPDDEFRIVQTRPTLTNPAGKHYFNISLDRNFILLRQFGAYQVFERG